LTRWPASETDVAQPVVAWLRAGGWDVYQEVRQGRGERSCDIVATRGPLVWAVEVKVQFGIEVLEQAIYWSQYANYSSVAVPQKSSRRGNGVVYRLALSHWGIGVFEVGDPSKMLWREAGIENPSLLVKHERCPVLHRRGRAAEMRTWLYEEQKSYLAAGTACGGGWSPYKQTCQALRDKVRQHPGCTLREAIVGREVRIGEDGTVDYGWAGIKHHYRMDSTAISSLKVWLEKGKVPGVRLEHEGRYVRLYPQKE